MKNNKILFFFVISILLINITFGKTSSNDDEVKSKTIKDQKYIIVVNNIYGEFKIFSNPDSEKNEKREELKSYEYAVTLMDKIDELIKENKDTYKDQEKLEEIENKNLLRKRDEGDKILNNYDNSSFVNPILSNGNTLFITAYLSEILVEKIKKMENIRGVFPDNELNYDGIYNRDDILKETSWKELKVQENATLSLSILSQGIYNDQIIGKYDNSYYCPKSEGENVNVIVIDTGFDFTQYEFSNSERTVECKVKFEEGSISLTTNKKKCGNKKITHGNRVAGIIGGRRNGVAKKANIYGISLVADGKTTTDASDLVLALSYVKENMIKKNKTVINISSGSYLKYSSSTYKELMDGYNGLIKSINELGGIVVGTSGNTNENVRKSNEVYMPCASEEIICVGGIESKKVKDITNKFEKHESSSYGDEVEIYAPGVASAMIVEEEGENLYDYTGTSYSTALVSGVIATIISETGKGYNRKTMLEFLKNKGIPFEVDGKTRWVINNGKHIVYSKNNEYYGCGVNAGNIPCNQRCGPSYGKCRDLSACCSSKNYCNTTSAHCGTGCQPKYGLCINEEDRCGPGYGRCPSGKCCSKYGWCGKKSDYCGTGCQPRYGLCN